MKAYQYHYYINIYIVKAYHYNYYRDISIVLLPVLFSIVS